MVPAKLRYESHERRLKFFFIKERSMCFPVYCVQFFTTAFLKNTCEHLLLTTHKISKKFWNVKVAVGGHLEVR